MFGLLTLLVLPAPAADELPTYKLPIQVQLIGGSAPLRGALRVTVEWVERTRSDVGKPALEIVPTDGVLQLLAGKWRLTPKIEAYWTESAIIDLPTDNASLSFRAWPATKVSFSPSPPVRTLDKPTSIAFLVAPWPAETPPVDAPDSGKALCEQRGPVSECELPRSVFDLRLSYPGFAPVYRWSVDISARTNVDLGRIEFVPGGSVSGFVEDQGGQRVPGIDVALQTAEGERILEAMPSAQGSVRPQPRALSSRTDARGFFQITGLAPGQYRLAARPSGGATAAAYVGIASNAESRLPSPMVLNDPVVVDVFVDPVRPPDGGQWTVTLRGLDSSDVVSETMPGGGSLQLASIGAGRYLVTVETEHQTLLAREVDVVAPATRLDLQLSLKLLRGRLKLGNRPLSGSVTFGGRNGAPRIELHADEEGAFEGYLPRAGAWFVDVEANQPPVRRSLRFVEVAAGEEGYTTEIRLPDTHLVGTVVDERLRPVAGAIVHLKPLGVDDSKLSLLTDPDGRFEATGLPTTGVLASAIAPDDLGSDPVVLMPDDGHASSRAQLVMSRRVSFRGQVTWQDTRSPVVGAYVKITGLSHVQSMSSSVTTTDSAGKFDRLLPASTLAVDVTYGLANQVANFVRVPLTRAETPLVLPRAAGLLTVVAGRRMHERTHRIALFRGDALTLTDYLLDVNGEAIEGKDESQSGAAETGIQGQPIRLTMGLAPGRYTACAFALETLSRTGVTIAGPRPDPDRCVAGDVVAGAETHLQLPDVVDPLRW